MVDFNICTTSVEFGAIRHLGFDWKLFSEFCGLQGCIMNQCVKVKSIGECVVELVNKMLSYRRETALQCGSFGQVEDWKWEIRQYFNDIIGLSSTTVT